MKKSEIFFGLLRIPIDFSMAFLAFYLAFKLRQIGDFIPGMELPVDLLNFPPLTDYLEFAAFASFFLVIIFAIDKMYSLRNTTRIGSEIPKVIILSATWIMLLIAYYFLTRQLFFSRLVLGYILVLTIVLITFGRLLIRLIQWYFCTLGIGRRRILFIGDNIVAKRIAETFKKNLSYQIVGYLSSSSKPLKLQRFKRLGNLKDLSAVSQTYRVEEIIQTHSDLSEAQAKTIIDFCRENHIQYYFVPDILQVHRTQVDVFNISGLPLISLKTTPLDGWGKVIKRLFDFIGALILSILLLPFLLLIAILIKLDSKGPVFFIWKDDGSKVKRVGMYGKPFTFYKFRTMKDKTDSLRYTALADRDHRKGSPLVKIKNDPRVTRFGKFLRRFSLDELPQLWNVLTGDMSLVGPRPHLPEEVEKYEKNHKFLLSIKPGITGLAQVNGRSDLDFTEEARLDTYYIENWSLFLDIKILLRTLFVVSEGKGAD